MKTYFVSLGCPKNLTDTEVLMGKLTSEGNEITTDPAEAETIIVNTCAFIKTARDDHDGRFCHIVLGAIGSEVAAPERARFRRRNRVTRSRVREFRFHACHIDMRT